MFHIFMEYLCGWLAILWHYTFNVCGILLFMAQHVIHAINATSARDLVGHTLQQIDR